MRWNTTGITVAGMGNIAGSANHLLNNSRDIILDHENNLYIADSGNHRIQKFFSGSLNGITLIGNGTAGSSQHQLHSPSRVIIDSNGNLYISDILNHRIQFWRNGALSASTVAGITGE